MEALVLYLFAGCGGLSFGFEAAGFRAMGYEMDKAAAHTYNTNLLGECIPVTLDLNFCFPRRNHHWRTAMPAF